MYAYKHHYLIPKQLAGLDSVYWITFYLQVVPMMHKKVEILWEKLDASSAKDEPFHIQKYEIT
jgi:hypothetical protein